MLDPPAGRANLECNIEREIDGFNNVRGGVRQSSLNAVLDGKHKQGKKKPGILRGIGSMFRFGKHRKMDSGSALDQLAEPAEFEPEPIVEPKEKVSQETEKQVQEDQRTQEQYNNQQQQQIQHQHHASQHQPTHPHPPSHQTNHQLTHQQSLQQSHQHPRPRPRQMDHHHHSMIPEGSMMSSSSKYHRENDNSGIPSRSERVHNLRSQHQQRHVERQGHYPSDEREEHYEEVIRQVSLFN